MTLRILDAEATMRILTMVRDGKQPLKIVEHKERMEAATAAAERRHSLGGSLDQSDIKCLVDMKFALDALYGDLAEGIERVRWVDISGMDNATPEVVVRECVLSTESPFGNLGVEVLAAYLDACGQDRLLFRLGEACALHVREYLEGVIPEDVSVLDSPMEYFGTDDQDILRRELAGHFRRFVNHASPRHIIRAMIANLEWGLGNAVSAIDEAGYAYCEKTVEQHFGYKLLTGHPDADKVLLDFELWKAEVLLGFLK